MRTYNERREDGLNWHIYAYNNPLRFIDPTGLESLDHIVFQLYRHIDSPNSRNDDTYQGMDQLIVENTDSGEIFGFGGGQTVSNHEDYSEGNSLLAYSGYFELDYLGEANEDGELINGYATNFDGPIFNITGANLESGQETDQSGSIVGDPDTTPIRMHSDTYLNGNTTDLLSGGCPMFPLEKMESLGDTLSEWGANPGDSFKGLLHQDYYQ